MKTRGQESGVRDQGVSGKRFQELREPFSSNLHPDTP